MEEVSRLKNWLAPLLAWHPPKRGLVNRDTSQSRQMPRVFNSELQHHQVARSAHKNSRGQQVAAKGRNWFCKKLKSLKKHRGAAQVYMLLKNMSVLNWGVELQLSHRERGKMRTTGRALNSLELVPNSSWTGLPAIPCALSRRYLHHQLHYKCILNEPSFHINPIRA